MMERVMTKEYEWPFEISGLGGSYELSCRNMIKAGVLWLRKHPEEPRKWKQAEREYRKRTRRSVGVPSDVYPPSYKEFERAIAKASRDCTCLMFGVSSRHAMAIFTKGWEEYVKYVMDKRAKREEEMGVA